MYSQLATNTVPIYGGYNSVNSIYDNISTDNISNNWNEVFNIMLNNNNIDSDFLPKNYFKEPYNITSAIADVARDSSFVDPRTLGPDVLHSMNPILVGQKDFTYCPGQDWNNLNGYAKLNLMKDLYGNAQTIGYNNMLTEATKEISDGKLSAINSYRPLDLSKVMMNNSSNYRDNIEPSVDIACGKYLTTKKFNNFYQNDNHYLAPIIDDTSNLLANNISNNYENRSIDYVEEDLNNKTLNLVRNERQNIMTNGYNDVEDKNYRTNENYKLCSIARKFNNDCIVDNNDNIYKPTSIQYHELDYNHIDRMNNYNRDYNYVSEEQKNKDNLNTRLNSKRLYYNQCNEDIKNQLDNENYLVPNFEDEEFKKYKSEQLCMISDRSDETIVLDKNIIRYSFIDENKNIHLPIILALGDSDRWEEIEHSNKIINTFEHEIDLTDYVNEVESLLRNKKNIIILPGEISELSKPVITNFINDLKPYFTEDVISKGINICSIDDSNIDIMNYMEILNGISENIKNNKWKDLESLKKLDIIGKQIITVSDNLDWIKPDDRKIMMDLYKNIFTNEIVAELKNGKVLMEVNEDINNLELEEIDRKELYELLLKNIYKDNYKDDGNVIINIDENSLPLISNYNYNEILKLIEIADKSSDINNGITFISIDQNDFDLIEKNNNIGGIYNDKYNRINNGDYLDTINLDYNKFDNDEYINPDRFKYFNITDNIEPRNNVVITQSISKNDLPEIYDNIKLNNYNCLNQEIENDKKINGNYYFGNINYDMNNVVLGEIK